MGSRIPRRTFVGAAMMSLTAHSAAPELRLLIITGGHDFEEEPFFEIFRSTKNIRYIHERFGTGAEKRLAPESAGEFDAMLFYDMHQEHEPHWNAWMELLDRGMPSIFLHHALGSYVKVPEYLDIVGGRARFTASVIPGSISTFWQHDQEIRVRVADRQHPITRGLEDFTIHDECYRGFYVRPDAHVLLTTDHPLNDRNIAWTYRYKNSPIVYIQLGHDHAAYANPNFRMLLAQALDWAASQGKTMRPGKEQKE